MASPSYSGDSTDFPRLTTSVRSVLGWPSNTFSIHHVEASTGRPEFPHTVLVFIPGNPGLIEWYTPSFYIMVQRLGRGFSACGVSNAGAGLTDEILNVHRTLTEADKISNDDRMSTCIPWTVDGQVAHKVAYMNLLEEDLQSMKNLCDRRSGDNDNNLDMPRYVFVSHSIGAHFTQRMCVLRPDILERTALLLHLMPFFRMDARPKRKQMLLDFAARHPTAVIAHHKNMMRLMSVLPFSVVEKLCSLTMEDSDSRVVAVRLIRKPAFANNFFGLGLEEIRDVPEFVDVSSSGFVYEQECPSIVVIGLYCDYTNLADALLCSRSVQQASALRFIGQHSNCHTALLYGGNDQWAPEFHMGDLQGLIRNGTIPDRITIRYEPTLNHDYVMKQKTAVPIVVDFCLEQIRLHVESGGNGSSPASVPFRSNL